MPSHGFNVRASLQPPVQLAAASTVATLKSNPFRDAANNRRYPPVLTMNRMSSAAGGFLYLPARDLGPADFDLCCRSTSYQYRRNYAGLCPFSSYRRMCRCRRKSERTQPKVQIADGA